MAVFAVLERLDVHEQGRVDGEGSSSVKSRFVNPSTVGGSGVPHGPPAEQPCSARRFVAPATPARALGGLEQPPGVPDAITGAAGRGSATPGASADWPCGTAGAGRSSQCRPRDRSAPLRTRPLDHARGASPPGTQTSPRTTFERARAAPAFTNRRASSSPLTAAVALLLRYCRVEKQQPP
jgi:hypothetical protein